MLPRKMVAPSEKGATLEATDTQAMDEFWLVMILAVAAVAASGGLLLTGYGIAISVSSAREARRGGRRLAELARMAHLESAQFWKQNERFWERSDRRWSDHEVLMRMILERTDRRDADQADA